MGWTLPEKAAKTMNLTISIPRHTFFKIWDDGVYLGYLAASDVIDMMNFR